MLSYRHAFHAGNHADVLKHFVVVQLLRHLNLKDKPWWMIDTHAGAGAYALDSERAKKNAEHKDGIARLWARSDLPPALADYVDLVRSFNPDGILRRYPGSPHIALRLARDKDKLRLFELHGSDDRALRDNLGRDFPGRHRQVGIEHADGFVGLQAILPPPTRRGLILIDPSYEDKRDYLRAVMTLKEGLKRFATGCFAIWYPCLPRGDARELPEKLAKLAPDWLDIGLTVRAPAADGHGMHGSGMLIVNPPWTLRETLARELPVLRDLLAQDETAAFSLRSADEAPPRQPPSRNSPRS